ncbi:MAG: hypothetical protein WC279_15040 [Sulfurimonas sp.]|uniref:hypothetical protein n=1 Tax=Sulfurimonas sp. TaxID=2022749 RepID=UPI003563979B
MMSYIKTIYRVPAEYGRRIRFQGKEEGIIVNADGQYIEVLMDKSNPGHTGILHPTWEVEYLNMREPRKPGRSAQRYRDYIRSETDMSFIDWLRYKQYKKDIKGCVYE